LSSTTNFWIRWRVRVGYPVGIAAFGFARPQMKWLLCGVGIAILGLLLRGYAAGHLRKHKQLASSGPYAFTRNPLYLGSVLLAMGFSVASHSWVSTLLLAAYLAIFYPVVIRREQAELKTLYGAAFVEYAAQVPAFWPRLSPAMASTKRFSWPLYRQNREYEAAIGLAVAMAILWILMLVHSGTGFKPDLGWHLAAWEFHSIQRHRP
jgi:protein-S-isoprenylcysteine O-methyltransferase Ste14